MKTSVDNQRNNSNITSIRLINKVVEEVCADLPQHLRETAEDRPLCDQWSEEHEYSFPSLFICPAVGEWQEGEGQLLSFKLLIWTSVRVSTESTVPSKHQDPKYAVSGRDGGVEVDWVFWPRHFPERQLAVPVQATHWKMDSGPPVED